MSLLLYEIGSGCSRGGDAPGISRWWVGGAWKMTSSTGFEPELSPEHFVNIQP